MANEIINLQNTEIVLYQPDESTSLEVRLEEDTVWLTQAQMITLFNSSKANISEHISNIYKQGELQKKATVRKFRTVRKEGNRMVSREMDFYNQLISLRSFSKCHRQQDVCHHPHGNPSRRYTRTN